MVPTKANLKVPYFDLTAQYRDLRDEIRDAIDRVCSKAGFILGEEVERFEQAFAKYCGVKHCVGLNSGTSALHLALLATGIGPGDEVITTANTFIATVEAIIYTGATPVFADIDPATANINPEKIEQAITRMASDHRFLIIEDACQAHGASFQGKRVGGFGHSAAFSFYPGKNLGAYGEGGALTTNDDEVAKLARALRSHGETVRYVHKYVGYNYRMDGFQAAVLNVKLKHLDEWTSKRQAFSSLYGELLADARVDLPQDSPEAECVYHLFVAYVEDRDRVRAALQERGVQTAVHYPKPVHLQEGLQHLGYKEGSLPRTERSCERVMSMPLFPEMTVEQVRHAASSLREIVGTLS